MCIRDSVKRSLQIGHRHILVDDKTLHLMENRGVRSVHLVGAVNAPRANDADRRFAGEHGARLHRGCVRTQNDIIPVSYTHLDVYKRQATT